MQSSERNFKPIAFMRDLFDALMTSFGLGYRTLAAEHPQKVKLFKIRRTLITYYFRKVSMYKGMRKLRKLYARFKWEVPTRSNNENVRKCL